MCRNCGDTWNHHRRWVIARGAPFRGGNEEGWYGWQGTDSGFNPFYRPPTRGGIIFGDKPIHGSHSLTAYRGLIYCNRCGYYTTGGRVCRLAVRCGMKPDGAKEPKGHPGHKMLKRIRQGKPPVGKWPRPGEWQCPQDLVPHWVNGKQPDMDSVSFQLECGKGPKQWNKVNFLTERWIQKLYPEGKPR